MYYLPEIKPELNEEIELRFKRIKEGFWRSSFYFLNVPVKIFKKYSDTSIIFSTVEWDTIKRISSYTHAENPVTERWHCSFRITDLPHLNLDTPFRYFKIDYRFYETDGEPPCP